MKLKDKIIAYNGQRLWKTEELGYLQGIEGLPGERWLYIPEEKESVIPRYFVSNLGRVVTIAYRRKGDPRYMRGTAKLLGTWVTSTGYHYCKLYGQQRYLHRLVAEAFCRRAHFGLRFVEFIDGNKDNIRADNLKWVRNTNLRKKALKQRGRHPSEKQVPNRGTKTDKF